MTDEREIHGLSEEAGASYGLSEEGSASYQLPEEAGVSCGLPEEGSASYGLPEEAGVSCALPAESLGSANLAEILHTGNGIESPFMRDIFLVRQVIVGTRFQGGSDELVEDLKPGCRVSFVREPENRFDSNAILLFTEEGKTIKFLIAVKKPWTPPEDMTAFLKEE